MTWVDCTHDDAIEEITAAMITAGRRRLVLLNGPKHVSAYALRSAGFWRAVERLGTDDLTCTEVDAEMNYAAGASAGAALSDADAVICSADSTAGGVLERLRELGRDTPSEVEVTGFDDTPFSAHSNPPLTTVRMPLRETGEQAVRFLIEMTESGATPEPETIPTEVVWRGSTGARGGERGGA